MCAKITIEDCSFFHCGTAFYGRVRDAEITFRRNNAVNCKRVIDLGDPSNSKKDTEGEKRQELHQTPIGIVGLNVAGLLSGTAIGRVIGLL